MHSACWTSLQWYCTTRNIGILHIWTLLYTIQQNTFIFSLHYNEWWNGEHGHISLWTKADSHNESRYKLPLKIKWKKTFQSTNLNVSDLALKSNTFMTGAHGLSPRPLPPPGPPPGPPCQLPPPRPRPPRPRPRAAVKGHHNVFICITVLKGNIQFGRK
jgi:hypothetical protein